MGTYIVRRLLQAVVVLILVSLIVFFLMRLLPGDPVLMYISQDEFTTATAEHIADLHHQFGLDKPFFAQYFDWISGVLHGDFGRSIMRDTPVITDIKRSLPISLNIGILAAILSVIIGIPLGLAAAVRRGTWIDTVTTTIANIGITAPVFWVGILLIYAFGLYFDWLPVYGYTSPTEDFGMNLRQLIMPVACIFLFPMAGIARQTRSAMLEVIRQDYIRTAWSKGLRERVVIMKHALKNGLIPVVTVVGMIVRHIFGGAVLVETVFNIPGIAWLAMDSILNQDYPVVQGVVLVIAVIVALVNLAVDLSYGWIDPRVRYG